MAKKLCVASLLILLVTACGQKKPLVRNEQSKPAKAQSSQTVDNQTKQKEDDH